MTLIRQYPAHAGIQRRTNRRSRPVQSLVERRGDCRLAQVAACGFPGTGYLAEQPARTPGRSPLGRTPDRQDHSVAAGRGIAPARAGAGANILYATFDHPIRFSYWRGKKAREVDLVAEVGGQIIPFEVKYRAQHTGMRDLKGLLELCQQKSIDRGYVVTKSLSDFGLVENLKDTRAKILRIPAALLCYLDG